MSAISQLIINGLIAGSIYALVASGFSLIFSTNKFMHIAHGINVVIGAYIMFTLFSALNLNFSLSVLITIFFMGLFGLGMYRFIYLPLQNRKASNLVLLIASIGLLILFENIIQLIFGSDTKTIRLNEVSSSINILGGIITELQVIIIIISIILLITLYIFTKKTKLGRNMRAVSDNKELASIIGINTRKISDYSFIIGSYLAAVAGILIALEQNLHPSMGTNLIIKGFTGAVIGGVTSVPASIVGSYFLGLVENIGIWFLPSGYKDAIAFILLFLFLLFKPTGIFGIDRGIKNG